MLPTSILISLILVLTATVQSVPVVEAEARDLDFHAIIPGALKRDTVLQKRQRGGRRGGGGQRQGPPGARPGGPAPQQKKQGGIRNRVKQGAKKVVQKAKDAAKKVVGKVAEKVGNAAGKVAAFAGGVAAAAGAGNAQTSLTLLKSVLATGFENDGQKVKEAGQVPSLTSKNNFINYCEGKKITNGQQVKQGSCNPAPMGDIPSTDRMPSCKFQFPINGANVNGPFTIKLKMKNLDVGHFTNAQQNYYAAPQQLNKDGVIVGHTHVVIEKVNGIRDIEPTDPKKFAFFKGVNTAADAQGILSVDVTTALPDGVYRLASINAAMNHQPTLAPIAQHGSLDDMVYFTVGAAAKAQAAKDFDAAVQNPPPPPPPAAVAAAAAAAGAGAKAAPPANGAPPAAQAPAAAPAKGVAAMAKKGKREF